VVNAARLTIDRITKSFGTTAVLKDISIDVEPGEFMTFLGPSGCGKTTLLRMIGGFLEPTSGEIVIAGRPVTSLPPNKRDCGFVFQSYALFPHMTVAKNVGYGLKLRRMPAADLERRVGEVLDMVGLAEFAGRYPRQLSGGQQQRVAIARAIAIRPSILLLDEPLSNLDAKLRERIRFELRDLQRKLGITTIFVTHDQDEAMVVSDRIVVMNRGNIEQIGAPRDIYRLPASEFVADFVGINNILSARVVGEADGSVRLATGFGEIVSTDRRPGLPPEVRLTIRPEAIEPLAAGATPYTGRVTLAAYLGATARCEVEMPDGTVLKVSHPRAGTLAIGDTVSCRWAPEDVHVLA
jgi:ABC-type Fe3+/spermidine/putrescine transport system ATPase subunit